MSLPTYEEAYATARDEPPFSNADEGYGWMAAWCERPCYHDREARIGDGPGCPLIAVALMGRTPREWLDQTTTDASGAVVPYTFAGQYTCVMFRPDDHPGPDEPTPVPDLPGQSTLFDRDEWERPARMYADTKPVEVDV